MNKLELAITDMSCTHDNLYRWSRRWLKAQSKGDVEDTERCRKMAFLLQEEFNYLLNKIDEIREKEGNDS